MICSIVNQYDPYTLDTVNFDAAALAVWHLGKGQWGLATLKGENGGKHLSTPVQFGWEQWARGRYLPGHDQYIAANWRVIADACDSVLIGERVTRLTFLAAIPFMAPERVREYRRELYDQQRTSQARIGEMFWSFASDLRAKYGASSHANV